MSKITFRADDDLVQQLEAFDASKSEVMREALRSYLNEADKGPSAASVNDALSERVDQLVAQRLDARLDAESRRTPDVNVNVTLDGMAVDDSALAAAEPAVERRPEADVDASDTATDDRKTASADDGGTTESGGPAPQTNRKTCEQCGEKVGADDVYCPNCGEKATHRVFCECGDELRSDWAFCPGCGRRTPAADVLNRS